MVNQPPRVGPIAGPITTPNPKMPMAMPCSSGGNVSLRMAWETGINAPPPMPWIILKRTMEAMLRAVPHITELAVNNRTLNMKKRLRPNREANSAIKGMMMTLESIYPVATQVISSTDAFRLPRM